MNAKTISTASDGLIIGATTLVRSWTFPQPSTLAASRMSFGNARITDARKYVPKALWMTVNMMITESCVL